MQPSCSNRNMQNLHQDHLIHLTFIWIMMLTAAEGPRTAICSRVACRERRETEMSRGQNGDLFEAATKEGSHCGPGDFVSDQQGGGYHAPPFARDTIRIVAQLLSTPDEDTKGSSHLCDAPRWGLLIWMVANTACNSPTGWRRIPRLERKCRTYSRSQFDDKGKQSDCL